MEVCEAGWSTLQWSGLMPTSLIQEGAQREIERAGFGKWLQPGGWARPSVENTFPKPLGQEGAPLLLLRSGDYRSELQSKLQTGLIASLGELDEQAKRA